jgi:hypothetical protein
VIVASDPPMDGAWLTLFGGLLAASGTLVPWAIAKGPGASISRNAYQLGGHNMVTLDGPLCLALGLLTIVIGWVRLRRRPISRVIARFSILTGILVGLVLGDRWSGLAKIVNGLNDHSNVIAMVSYGYWMCAAGAVFAVLGGVIIRPSRVHSIAPG